MYNSDIVKMEDVDFMLKNSKQDSVTLFVDSSLRNKMFYHTPAQYVISFNEPFKNIYGIEVMDATIPVSMYNVDVYNDGFALSQVYYTQGNGKDDFLNRFAEVQYNKHFNTLFEGEYTSLIFISTNPGHFASIATGSGVSQHMTPTLFLLYNYVTSTTIRILNEHVSKQVTDKIFTYKDTRYLIDRIDPVCSVIDRGDYTMATGVDGVTTLTYYTHVYLSTERGNELVDTFASTPSYSYIINNMYGKIEHGNYDGLSLLQYMGAYIELMSRESRTSTIGSFSINTSQSASFGDITKQSKMKWSSIGIFPFILDMKKGTLRDALGFSSFSIDAEHHLYQKLHHYNNHQLFMSRTDSFTSNDDPTSNVFKQTINPPGIISLLGGRFILLRIPEIENHLLNSFATSSFSPGIGMFKLAGGNDVTNLRFDFVNLIKKPFHPIGRLTKLTIRFELSNGKLYDFKGVDHHLLINIKYYAPNNTLAIPKYILNPNYNYDVLQYLSKHGDNNNIDDIHKRAEALEPDYQKKFLDEQRRYDYESDESSEDY